MKSHRVHSYHAGDRRRESLEEREEEMRLTILAPDPATTPEAARIRNLKAAKRYRRTYRASGHAVAVPNPALYARQSIRDFGDSFIGLF